MMFTSSFWVSDALARGEISANLGTAEMISPAVSRLGDMIQEGAMPAASRCGTMKTSPFNGDVESNCETV